VLAYVGVAAYACTLKPAAIGLVGGFAVVGLGLHTWVLVRSYRELLPWAMLCGAAAYAVALFVHGAGVDGAAPLVATGLLVSAELATWSLDERHRLAVERAVVLGRAAGVAALAGAGLVAASLVVGLAAAPGGAGLAWTLLGAAAAVLAVGIAARVAR
jgi:hypothetical protein